MTASMSVMVYAIRTFSTNPKTEPDAAVMTIARGDAIEALEHSSARWNGASYPLIVQQMARNDIRTATPSGQSVKFWMPQATLVGWNLGTLLVVVGMMIMVARRASTLMTVPTALK